MRSLVLALMILGLLSAGAIAENPDCRDCAPAISPNSAPSFDTKGTTLDPAIGQDIAQQHGLGIAMLLGMPTGPQHVGPVRGLLSHGNQLTFAYRGEVEIRGDFVVVQYRLEGHPDVTRLVAKIKTDGSWARTEATRTDGSTDRDTYAVH